MENNRGSPAEGPLQEKPAKTPSSPHARLSLYYAFLRTSNGRTRVNETADPLGRQTTTPLEPAEAAALGANLALSQLIILVGGVAGSIAVAGLRSGNWMEATVGLGWLDGIVASLTAASAVETVVIGCATVSLLCALAWASERRALSTDKGRASVYRTRRGINGELPRLPIIALVPLMALTGFAEELLFRFAAIGLIGTILSFAAPPFLAAGGALVASSTVFWLAHSRYRDLATTVLTLALGLGLGSLFLATESLAAVAVAHALYDFAVLIIARIQMRRDPDYFGGPAPTRVLLDQLED